MFWNRNRYHFEGDSVASGAGVLINKKKYRLQNGFFGFNIREVAYEFEYNIDVDDEDDVRGTLGESVQVFR